MKSFFNCIQDTKIICDRKGIRPVMVFLATFLLILMAACAPTVTQQPEGQDVPRVEFATAAGPVNLEVTPPKGQVQKSNDCPGLDSQLYQFSQAQDAAQLAAQLGFRVVENKVQVLLVLNSEDLTFLNNFGVDVGGQSGKQVQAFVPFDQLCALAKNDSVLAIRPAAQAMP